MDIAERNRLRAEAHLPLLDVAAEISRLEKAEAEAEFEQEWDRRKPRTGSVAEKAGSPEWAGGLFLGSECAEKCQSTAQAAQVSESSA